VAKAAALETDPQRLHMSAAALIGVSGAHISIVNGDAGDHT